MIKIISFMSKLTVSIIAYLLINHMSWSETDSNNKNAILVHGSGTYHREISTQNKLAQQFFDQGLRYAWGFYFPESTASYLEAAKHDPTHPMIFWGLAHALGPNPNSRYIGMPDDPKSEGLKAITKALKLIDHATPKERDMINAMYVLYDKDSISDNKERDLAYLDAAGELHRKYPKDPDITALYAAAYMNISRWNYWNKDGSPVGASGDIASVLEKSFKNYSDHPGTNHLYIHLMEASRSPEKALPSADRLAATMPMAGHMVHMPSHIYVRVGQFEKAVASNVRSQEVDKEFLELWGDRPLPHLGTYPLSAKIHAPHAIDFIKYAAAFQGNYQTAIDAANQLVDLIDPSRYKRGRNQKQVSGICLTHRMFGRWDEILDSAPIASGTPYLDGIWSYCRGGAHISKGNLAAARLELGKIWQLISLNDVDKHRAGPTQVSSILRLAAHGLSGEIKQASGDILSAIKDYESAIAIEDKNAYIEPPDWPQPIRHYLGDALLQAGEPKKAEEVYRKDLDWHQNNGWALFGLWQSLAAQGKSEEADEAYKKFRHAWRNADTNLTRSRI